MNLAAYARLLHRKINSAHKKAKNPFINADYTKVFFYKPVYTTLVWIEPDDENINEFDKKRVQ